MDYGSLFVHAFDMCQFVSYKFVAQLYGSLSYSIYYNCGPYTTHIRYIIVIPLM